MDLLNFTKEGYEGLLGYGEASTMATADLDSDCNRIAVKMHLVIVLLDLVDRITTARTVKVVTDCFRILVAIATTIKGVFVRN